MVNRLLMYFYKEVLKTYGNSYFMYTIAREIVHKNIMECSNLAECFNKCKVELYLN